ncbi:uncharacterized protein LOC126816058 isoform X2 [Patella vulgata]|uniref:uncharacterized protein LOC126816058 isoform X2 n=1 Tax=Patella vulgata TaxID=6465 RepID=UPI00217FB36B|nr:uncharacterized protein LOC126816058 isoform X2 [Patella vulgata]
MNTEAASNFINSLVRNLQVLCHSNVDFSEDVEVIGHIYLSVDKSKKFNYIVNEKVCKSDDSSTVFVSNSFHADQKKKEKETAPARTGQSDSGNDERDTRHKRHANFGNERTQYHHQGPHIGNNKRSTQHFSQSEYSSPPQKQRRHNPENRLNTPVSRDSFSVKSETSDANSALSSPHHQSYQSPSKSSPAKSSTPSSDPVDIDLTSIKDEPIEDKSCIFSSDSSWNQQSMMDQQLHGNQHNRSRLGSSSNYRDQGEEQFGIYPVAMHQINTSDGQLNIEALSQMSSSNNPSTSGELSDQLMSMVPADKTDDTNNSNNIVVYYGEESFNFETLRRRNKKYTMEEKMQALRSAKERGVVVTCKELQIPHSTLCTWKATFRKIYEDLS